MHLFQPLVYTEGVRWIQGAKGRNSENMADYMVARLSTCVWSSTRVLVAWSHLGYTSIPFTSPKVPLWYGWCQIIGAIKLGPGQLLYPYIRNGKVAAYVYNRGDGVCETEDIACVIFAFMAWLSANKCNG